MPYKNYHLHLEPKGRKPIPATCFLLIVFLCVNLLHGFGQDQRVADSLALIYHEGNLQGVEKMELLKDLSFNELNDGGLSLKYADELIQLAEKEGNSDYLFNGYLQKGENYKITGDLDLALEVYLQAANIAMEANDLGDQGVVYVSVADVYAIMENYDNAEHFYGQAIDILRTTGDSVPLASALLNAGDNSYNMGKYDEALRYFEESGPIFKKMNYTVGTAYNLGNIGMIYAKQGKDAQAKKNINEAIAILEELEDFYPISVYLTIMSDIYLKQGDFEAALGYTNRSLELASAYGLKKQIGDAYLQLSELHEEAGHSEVALECYKNFILYRDSVKNLEAIEQMADMRTDYEVAQKQIEVDLLTHRRENQRMINILAGFTSVLFIAMAIGLYTRYRFIKKTNVKIRKQQTEIVDSITYAKRIQSAMLPPESSFSELLNEHFIFYKPRDIVSGDFYWIKQVKQFVIIVAADCTGHGVPGAFMSMLGMSYLNEIVQRREVTKANQVLYEMRNQIRNSLRQNGKRDESKDGIDMALCVLDTENNTLQYAGANSPLYVIRNVKGKPELKEFKADRMPLGYYPGEDISFVNHDLQLDQGDAFYLFSDGFMDQKGGEGEKKFMSKKFKKLLLDIQDRSMADQKEFLIKTLSDWMGDHAQIDDLLVIGVRT